MNQEKPEELTQTDDVKMGTHVFLILLVSFCFIFFLWASFSKLDIVSSAQGEVFPSTKLKRIQHLEGGIIQAVKVKEGEKVKKGQQLVILESTSNFADVQQLELQINSLHADIARLDAESKDLEKILFPAGLAEKSPDLVKETKHVFKTKKERHENEKQAQKEQVVQREAELKEIQARLSNLKEELKLTDEQVKISEKLLEEDLTNRYNHIDLLRTLNSLKSRIEEDTAGVTRLTSALTESKGKLDGLDHKFKEEVSQQLEEANRELNELTKKMEKYADSLQRTILVSPTDGVVKQLYLYSRGEVVKPGETVLDILPSGDRLIVDAKLPIKDIGYVEIGQPVMIRLASADSMKFDHLNGKVVFISPDSIHEDEQEPYYRVRIETKRDYFKGSDGVKYQLYPGIQVMANIITGKRSVLAYVLDPFMGSFKEAMTER